MSDDSETRTHRRDFAKEAVVRVAKCIQACDGVDEAMLELLAKKDPDGKTLLQRILNQVDWSGAQKIIR